MSGHQCTTTDPTWASFSCISLVHDNMFTCTMYTCILMLDCASRQESGICGFVQQMVLFDQTLVESS